MSQQTAYERDMDKAFPGLIADLRPREIDSKLWEDSTDGIFGIFVTRGTNDNQVLLPTSAADQMLGVVVAQQGAKSLALLATSIVIEEKESLNVMREGNIYVTTEDACVPGDQVFVRYASGAGGTQLGASRTDDPGSEAVAVDWEFEETGAASAVVKIRKR
jgi:hypothetical protein